ncbi:MAG: hypothetical protein Q9222_005793 [Ikaeria aurantiellina]
MEAAGLVIGIISLYQAVIKIIDTADAYKHVGPDSRAAFIYFEAAKTRLQDWAFNVGIRDRQLTDHHDTRLDNPKRACIIKDTLECLKNLCERVEKTRSSIKLPVRSQRSETDGWFSSLDDKIEDLAIHQPLSKRSRLAWVAGGKGKVGKEIALFEGLVNTLYHVINPNKPFADNITLSSLSLEEQEVFSDQMIVLERIQKSIVALDSRDILDWLDATESDDDYEKIVAMHQDGTCGWILEIPKYKAWSSTGTGDACAKLLWIHGPAGFGKSVLTAWLIGQIKTTSGVPVAYCFSSSHTQRGDNLDSVVRTWISQIARNDNNVLHLCQILRDKQNTRRASRQDVWTLLKEIIVSLNECIFFLDGLDEFTRDDDNRSSFLRNLKKAIGSTGARVLITSRNEADIQSELINSPTEAATYIIFECKVSKEDVQDDVGLYSEAAVAKKFPKQTASFRRELSEKLAERAGGMFLWIKLQQAQLRGSQNRKTVQRIVEDMPQGLYQTYDRIWGKINELAEPDWSRAVRILRWLTFAIRPLTIQAVTEALAINEENTDDPFCEADLPVDIDDEYVNNEIKGLCYSFIEIQESAESLRYNEIHLSHASVRDYLIDRLPVPVTLQPCLHRSSFEAANHAVLATHCLVFLNFSKAWIRGEDDSYSAFTAYATHAWSKHALQSHEYYESISDLVHSFMDSQNMNFRKWRTYFESNLPHGEGIKGQEDTSPLAFACFFCLELTLRFLLKHERKDLDTTGRKLGSPLQIACMQGLHWVVDRLLSLGADITVQGRPLNTAINAAVDRGDYDLVKVILNQEALVGLPNARVQEATRTAINRGLVEIVEMLLDRTLIAFQEENYKGGWLAYVSEMLRLSADYGDTKVAEVAIARGADLNSRDPNGNAPLHMAASADRIELARFLLKNGAFVDSTGLTGATPLSHAAANGNSDMVAILLESGAAVDAQDRFGYTALHFALIKSYSVVADIRSEHDMDVDLSDNWGWRALDTAAKKGIPDICRMLLDKSADLELRTEDGETLLVPAGLSAPSQAGLEAANLLLQAGANPNVDRGTTAHVDERQRLDITGMLLQSMAAPSPNDEGMGPLHYAALDGLDRAVALLLDIGYCIDARENSGFTPLSFAIFQQHFDTAELLLRRGADVTIPLETGISLLHLAVEHQAWPCVGRLLEKGCDCNSRDSYGETVFSKAVQFAPNQLVEDMVHRGTDLMAVDGYGMSGLDWIKRLRPQLLPSPDFSQDQNSITGSPDLMLVRRKTLCSAASIKKNERRTKDLFYKLSKGLLLLGMEADARLAYQQQVLANEDGSAKRILCDGCDKESGMRDHQPWYTCKLCLNVDFCHECFATYDENFVLQVCRGHPFLEIVVSAAEFQYEDIDARQAWLQGLEDRLNSES